MQKIKKPISILLSLLMVLSVFAVVPFTVNAAPPGDSGDFSTDTETPALTNPYKYVVENGTAVITGYNGSDTELTIPSEIDGYTVTEIMSFVFNNNTDLKSVTIPNTVTYIGQGAFQECTALESVTIPDSVTIIREEAFRGCEALESVTIGSSVTSIGQAAFAGCGNLSNVTFVRPSAEQSLEIEMAAFWGVTGTLSYSGEDSYALNDGDTEIESGASLSTLSEITLTWKAPAGETIELNLNADNANITWDDYTADGTWDITADYDDGNKTLQLYADADHAEGTFTIGQELSTSSCYIMDVEGNGDTDIYFEAGSCTVTIDGDTVTVAGTFTGSDGNTYNVTITYVAPAPATYTVTWKNEDGSIIDTTEVEEGEVPTHVNPTKAANEQNTFTFTGWDPTPVAATADAEYTAQFTPSAIKVTSTIDVSELNPGNVINQYTSLTNNNGYTVRIPSGQARQWGNAGGVIIDHDVELTDYRFYGYSISRNASPYEYYVPVDGDGQGPSFAIESVDHAAKIVTVYSPVVYTVKWMSFDNRVLNMQKYLKGEVPSYSGSTPNKPADAEYTYTFAGWSPEITPATESTSYQAQYTASPLPSDYESTGYHTLFLGDGYGSSLGEITGTGATSGTATLSREGDYNVLTLDNFVYEGNGKTNYESGNYSYSAPLYYSSYNRPLIIRLIGENKLIHTDTSSSESNYGIYVSNAPRFIIEGEGSLTVSSGNGARGSVGMYVLGTNLVVSQCSLDVQAGTSSSQYYLTNGIDLNAGNCYIENGASVTVASGTNEPSLGMRISTSSNYGKVILQSGSVSVTGEKSALYYYDDSVFTNIVTASGSKFKVTKAGDSEADAVDVEPTELINRKYVYAEAGILHTVTWKNEDGSIIDTTEVVEGEVPTYTGETPTKAEDENYTYTFSGWSPEVETVTGDVTYTATFDAVSKLKKLISGHTLSLDGNIGINFYLDPAAAGLTADQVTTDNLSYTFAWEDGNALVDVAAQSGNTFTVEGSYIKVTCHVCAAEMSCGVNATFTLGDKTESEVYSVKKYGDSVFNATEEQIDDVFGGETEYNKLVDLMNKMLDYGAKAQTVFGIKTSDPANKDLSYTMPSDMPNFDWAIQEANGRLADDLTCTDMFGENFKAPSLVFLDYSTLKLYFENKDGSLDTSGLTKWNNYFYTKHENIAASQLDTLQTFTVSGKTFHYSALDYAKVLGTSANADNANLAKALYWYNQAANEYFG